MKIKQITTLCVGMVCSFFTSAETVDSTRVYHLQEVMIQASRSESQLKNLPQKIEIITSDQLRALPSDNLAELLKRATNLDIIQYPGISATIGMRGFSPSAHSRSYTLILINGKPSGTINLASLSTQSIEQIEVIKGPYAVLYGSDAMGGVINIITRKGDCGKSAEVSVESGSFGYQSLSAEVSGSISPKFSFGVGYTKQEQSENYRIGSHSLLHQSTLEEKILDKSSFGSGMENSKYNQHQLRAVTTIHLNNYWKINAEGTYLSAYDVETPGTFWGIYGQSKKDIERSSLYLDLEHEKNKNHLRFSPYLTSESNPAYSDNTEAGFINFKSVVKEYGYQLQDHYRFSKLNVLIGHDLKVYDYLSDRYSTAGTPTTPYKPNNRFINLSAFGQISWSIDRFSVNAGSRFDYFSYEVDANSGLSAPKADHSYTTWNPSLGALYEPIKNIRIHTAYGTAFSVPDAFQVAGTYTVFGTTYMGNPDLAPERSKSFDGGLGYTSVKNELKLDLTYFNTLHDRKIVEQMVSSGKSTFINANDSKMEGIELTSNWNFGKLFANPIDLEAYANFTWMLKADFSTGTGSQQVRKDLLYVRKSNGNFGLRYTQNHFTTNLNARWIGKRLERDWFSSQRPGITSIDYFTNGGYVAANKVLQHPNYLVMDLSASYDFNKHFRTGITVSNLMDQNYTEKDGYNMPGRSLTIKLSYKL